MHNFNIRYFVPIALLGVIALPLPAWAQTTVSSQTAGSCGWGTYSCTTQQYAAQGNVPAAGSAGAFSFDPATSSAAYPGNYPAIEANAQPLALPNGECWYVVNQSKNTYFIPLRTQVEWTAFKNAANQGSVSGLSLVSCNTVAPPVQCASNAFGCNQPAANAAQGSFYNLSAHAGNAYNMSYLTAQNRIPDLVFSANELNVPMQNYLQGFPGFPDLTKWFGLCYQGSWTAPASGVYTFVSAVDDGLALWIDGNLVGQNSYGMVNDSLYTTGQGGNGAPQPFSPVPLNAGPHNVLIKYIQAWPVSLQLQLWALPVGQTYSGHAAPPDSDFMQLGSPIAPLPMSCP